TELRSWSPQRQRDKPRGANGPKGVDPPGRAWKASHPPACMAGPVPATAAPQRVPRAKPATHATTTSQQVAEQDGALSSCLSLAALPTNAAFLLWKTGP